MTSCRTETETVSRMEKAGPFDCCCNHQSVALPSLWLTDVWFKVAGMSMMISDCLSACVRAHGGHFEHILWCCHGSICFELMLRIFEFGVLRFDCFVYRQNVTCLKCFTRYGHRAGEVEDIIIGRLSLKSLCRKNIAFSCGLMTLHTARYSQVQRGGAWGPLLAVPNVTAHPSTASVPTSYYLMWHYDCLWDLKGLI